jgi:hypothetical protein
MDPSTYIDVGLEASAICLDGRILVVEARQGYGVVLGCIVAPIACDYEVEVIACHMPSLEQDARQSHPRLVL